MARRVVWALAPALVCLVAGCLLPEGVRPDRASTSLRPRQELGRDTVVLNIALIERALHDSFLNEELWERADQLVVDPERKAILEENGLRVGQLVGPTASELQRLLTSERWCVAKTRILPSGQKFTQYLGLAQPHCQYDVFLGRNPLELQIDQARFCLEITPRHGGDTFTKLEFVPKVETAEQVLPFQPAPEQSTWVYRAERPGKSYPELSWQVGLRPNEYLIVGAHAAKKNTIGYHTFVDELGESPVQRVLVIRTARSPEGSEHEPTLEDIARSSLSPPLALQATFGAIRASRP